MKFTLEVDIAGRRAGVVTMRKTVDLPFTPSLGMRIDDPAWQDTKAIERITLGTCDAYTPIVALTHDRAADTDGVAELIGIYEAAGWHRPGQD